MPKEEYDDYLAKIKKRWDSALMGEEQNQNYWDDVWMTPKKAEPVEPPLQSTQHKSEKKFSYRKKRK